jgi:hypothetical protein
MRLSNPRTTGLTSSTKSYMTNGAAPKLSIETAREIKRRSDAGASNPELAKAYGVKTDTIRRAILRAAFAMPRDRLEEIRLRLLELREVMARDLTAVEPLREHGQLVRERNQILRAKAGA